MEYCNKTLHWFNNRLLLIGLDQSQALFSRVSFVARVSDRAVMVLVVTGIMLSYLYAVA